MDREPQVAFVHDALPFQGGAERVLAAALEAFPQAPVYTLVYREEAFHESLLARHTIRTSFIDRLPGARRRHRAFFPLMPLAVGRLDLRGYDVVVSFSYAVAHGARTRPGQLHISYTHTPLRYAWRQVSPFASLGGAAFFPLRWMLERYLTSFRRWDLAAAGGVDHFVAVSRWIADSICRSYERQADVLYPPVDVGSFRPLQPRGDYYMTLGRLVAQKKTTLAVEAFTQLGLPLLVVGEGPELPRLRRLAGPNVRLLGWQPRERVAELLGHARALVHPAEEDFGISMVEAQAAGCPVIAFDRGASREVVRDGVSGRFFAAQDVPALVEAVRSFEQEASRYDPEVIRAGVQRFDRGRFRTEFTRLVELDWDAFQADKGKISAMAKEEAVLSSPNGRSRKQSRFGREGEGPAWRVGVIDQPSGKAAHHPGELLSSATPHPNPPASGVLRDPPLGEGAVLPSPNGRGEGEGFDRSLKARLYDKRFTHGTRPQPPCA